MTIIQLEYFLAVVNSGSFSLAAERCFVTQPSLSMQIKNLEEELDVILLDRSKKPVVPTEAGKIVIESAREAIRGYNYVKESILEYKGQITGTLHLAVIPTIAPYLLPRFITDFVKRYPKVELEVKEITTPQIIEAMDRDQVDVAIIAGGTMPDRITEQEMFSDRFYGYVSTASSLFDRSNIRIEDIDAKQMVLLAEGHCLRDQIVELCQLKRSVHPFCSFECGSLETLMRVVDCTNYMTVIPEMTLDYIPLEHRKQIKSLAKGMMSRKISLAVRRTYVKQGLIGVLRQAIMETVAPKA